MSTIVHLEIADTERGKICNEWISANGITPKHVVAYTDAVVDDTTITVTEFALDAAGRRIFTTNSDCMKHATTYPLIVGPDAFGLESKR